MVDIPLDRMLQKLGVLDENYTPISDEKIRKDLTGAYMSILQLIKYYCDINHENASLLSLWCIGATNIEKFNTYPYLFINAMKGSGKTRLIRLLAKITGGDLVNSMTEAVLFRTKGTLAIDEFEGVNRKGSENLKELLNSAYKKGVKVKRMKKVHTVSGEEQRVEEFEVYRPIIMANIWGMEEVLGDRCIKIVLDKSNNPKITKRIERFDSDNTIKQLSVTLVHDTSCFLNIYKGVEEAWNNYLSNKYDTHDDIDTLHTQDTQDTLYLFKNKDLDEEFIPFFNKIDESNLNGRSLELAFPLLFISYFLDKETLFNDTLLLFKEIEEDKKSENITESYDIAFIDFVSQELSSETFIQVSELTRKFREFLNEDKEWISPDWVGRALKRLKLIKAKRRLHRGREVILDIPKAQDKIRMFK